MLKAGVNRAPELIHSLTTTIDQMTWKQNLVIPQRCAISGYKSKCCKMFGLSSSHWIPQPLCQVWLHLHYLYHDRPVVLELWPSDVSIQNVTKRFFSIKAYPEYFVNGSGRKINKKAVMRHWCGRRRRKFCPHPSRQCLQRALPLTKCFYNLVYFDKSRNKCQDFLLSGPEAWTLTQETLEWS